MSPLLVVEVLVTLAVVLTVAGIIAGRIDPPLTETPPDAAGDGLPPGPLAPEDVDSARFGLAFRGYRMDEVDRVLDRLRAELLTRDAEIERLRTLHGGAGGTAGTGAGISMLKQPEPADPGVLPERGALSRLRRAEAGPLPGAGSWDLPAAPHAHEAAGGAADDAEAGAPAREPDAEPTAGASEEPAAEPAAEG